MWLMSPDSEGFPASSSNTEGSKLMAPVFFTPVTAEILAMVSETQVVYQLHDKQMKVWTQTAAEC